MVGLLAMTQAVLPAMRRQGFGRIVNISSGTTRRVAVGVGAYASSKLAVNMLSEVLRQELAGDGIAVSLLLPSITATEFGDGMFTLGASPRPGMVAHSPDYVAGVVLRLLRTGEEYIRHPARPGTARPRPGGRLMGESAWGYAVATIGRTALRSASISPIRSLGCLAPRTLSRILRRAGRCGSRGADPPPGARDGRPGRAAGGQR